MNLVTAVKETKLRCHNSRHTNKMILMLTYCKNKEKTRVHLEKKQDFINRKNRIKLGLL